MTVHKFEVGQVVYEDYVFAGTNDLRPFKVIHANPDGSVYGVNKDGVLKTLYDHKDYFVEELNAWLSMRERFQKDVDARKASLALAEKNLARLDTMIAKRT